MRIRTRLAGIVGVICGGLVIASVALAAGAGPSRVTLGSTVGTPSANICVAGIRCTYVPISLPKLRVPFSGTVTRFRVHSASGPGKVFLRVLRPAGGSKFTGVGTSGPKTVRAGVNTFTVSLKVKAGDLIGLDNASSALMFDTSKPASVTGFYELPRLNDGQTAAPNHAQTNIRLLLSATVVR